MITGTVRKVIPGATYQGTVYDYTVLFETESGQTIELFDGTVPNASPDDEGQRREVEVTTLPPEALELASSASSGDITRRDDEMFVVVGRVGALPNDRSSTRIELDVGVGSILVSMAEDSWEALEDEGVEPGDAVRIETPMLHLTGISAT